MTDPRGSAAPLFAAIAAGIAAPAVYFIHVIAQDRWLVAIALGGLIVCAWRFSGALGNGAAHALYHRQVRDDATTRTIVDARPAMPALTDSARADYLAAQTDAVRWRIERDRAPEVRPRRPRISVFGEAIDDGGYNDGE